MKVGYLRTLLASFKPDTDIGVTVKTKDGDQFWHFSHEEVRTFGDPFNKKHRLVSLFSMAVRDPLTEGARIRNTDIKTDNMIVSPERAMEALKQYFDLKIEDSDNALQALSQNDVTELIFKKIHQSIAELVNINNSLCFYAKNRYAMTAKYFIDVESKKAKCAADLLYSFRNTLNNAEYLSDEEKEQYFNCIASTFDVSNPHELSEKDFEAKYENI